MSGLVPSARRVAEGAISALVVAGIIFGVTWLAQGGRSPLQWVVAAMAGAIAFLTVLLVREVMERASRSQGPTEVMSDGILWIQDDEAKQQPVCPEHRIPVMVWLHSIDEMVEAARLGPEKVDLRQDRLWCPGRTAGEEHNIRLAESNTWSQSWSIAATRLKGERLYPAQDPRPPVTAAPTPAPRNDRPPRPDPDVQPVLMFGMPAPMFNATLQQTQVLEGAVFGGRPPQRQRHPLQPRTIINHRVPITNTGSACEVRVKVEAIEPEVGGVFLPITLHVARDDPPSTELRRRFKESLTLGRGEMEWLDVIARDLEDASRCYLWNAAFEDAVQEVQLEGTYRVKLKAYAGDEYAEAEYEIYAPPILARLELRGPLDPATVGEGVRS